MTEKDIEQRLCEVEAELSVQRALTTLCVVQLANEFAVRRQDMDAWALGFTEDLRMGVDLGGSGHDAEKAVLLERIERLEELLLEQVRLAD